MDEIITVLLATGDDLLQPVVSEMPDATILGTAVRTDKVVDMVEDLMPKVLILADFLDPNMDLVHQLSSHFSKVRIIYVITSDNEQEVKEILVSLGVYDFLPHTFRKSELHKMIREPRGWHHLVADGMNLDQLLSKPSKQPREVKRATGIDEALIKDASLNQEMRPDKIKADRGRFGFLGKILKGLKPATKEVGLPKDSNDYYSQLLCDPIPKPIAGPIQQEEIQSRLQHLDEESGESKYTMDNSRQQLFHTRAQSLQPKIQQFHGQNQILEQQTQHPMKQRLHKTFRNEDLHPAHNCREQSSHQPQSHQLEQQLKQQDQQLEQPPLDQLMNEPTQHQGPAGSHQSIQQGTQQSLDRFIKDPTQKQLAKKTGRELFASPEEMVDQTISIRVIKQQIVAFWSAKPGTGKTFLAVNTAIALARKGVKVALVDGDLVNLSIGVHLNLMDVKKTLERALKCDNPREIDDCLLYHANFQSLGILSGSDQCRPESYCSFTRESVEKLFDYLKSRFDVIIIDTSSDIQTVTTYVAMQYATKIVLITNQDYAQVFATKKMFSLLKRLNIPQDRYYSILNGEMDNCKLTRDMVENMLGIQVDQGLPLLPRQVSDSIFDSQPIILQTGQDTAVLREDIEMLSNEIFPVAKGQKVSLFGNISKLLGKRGSMSYV